MTPLKADRAILIVDDSDDDYDAIVRALSRDGKLANPLHRCENGQQALDYLFHRGPYQETDEVAPGIILLDLNLPGIDGRKILATLKSDDKLRQIPVIVMTNSNAERDVEECYKLGANTYVRKFFNWPEFCMLVQRLKEYWFEVATLPKA
jgi:CheY-like chemotaxis protein